MWGECSWQSVYWTCVPQKRATSRCDETAARGRIANEAREPVAESVTPPESVPPDGLDTVPTAGQPAVAAQMRRDDLETLFNATDCF